MTIRSTIASRIQAIAADRVHGASALARLALATVAAAAVESEAPDQATFRAELNAVVAAIVAARPEMVAVRNWLERFLRRLAVPAPDVATLRQRAFDEATVLCRQVETAMAAVVARAAAIVPDGAVVATASFSQTVVETLIAAARRGKRPSVQVARSLVDGIAYGERLAAALMAAGIAADVVPDDRLVALGGAALGLIGADAVFADGGVVNGTPSRRLAEVLAAGGKPFFVLTETAKIDRARTTNSIAVLPRGFDLVPPALVTAIVTEAGSFPPCELVTAPLPA